MTGWVDVVLLDAAWFEELGAELGFELSDRERLEVNAALELGNALRDDKLPVDEGTSGGLEESDGFEDDKGNPEELGEADAMEAVEVLEEFGKQKPKSGWHPSPQ
jgi:hypothetical protein